MRLPFSYIFRGVVRLACIGVFLLLAACAAASPSGKAASAPTTTPTMDMQSPSAGTATATDVPITGPHVVISNFTFTPDTLNVPVGATVTWVNQDDIPHTVTSADNHFASLALDTGDRFTFKFTAAGTYSYFCSLHPKMVGKIIVQ